MADSEEINLWPHSPSFALAVMATVLYGLAFLWTTFLIFRHRAWFFLAIAVGAAIEVAGYAMRSYSIKNPTMMVSLSQASCPVSAARLDRKTDHGPPLRRSPSS